MKKYFCLSAFLGLLFPPLSALASSCNNYPAKTGIEVIETLNGEIKIKSTALATVPINDAELYIDAMDEAELKAKAKIARFLSEEIIDQCMDENSRTLSIDVTGEGKKSVNYKKVKKTLCSVKNRSSSILRGAKRISDCYTPGKFVMITVGIKPDSINNAMQLSESMLNPKIYNKTSSRDFDQIEGRSNIEGYLNF